MFSHPHESSEDHEKSSGWSSARQRLSRLFGLRRRNKRMTAMANGKSTIPHEDVPSNKRLPCSQKDAFHFQMHDVSSEHVANDSSRSEADHGYGSRHKNHHRRRRHGHRHNQSHSSSDNYSSSDPEKKERGRHHNPRRLKNSHLNSSSPSPSTDDEADDRTVLNQRDIISWRKWFLSRPGHSRLLLKIPDHFLADEFNFLDLISGRPHVRQLLSRIIGSAYTSAEGSASEGSSCDETSETEEGTEARAEESKIRSDFSSVPIIRDAVQLYTLLHARYIQTREGLLRMAKRYSRGDFGVCPRFNCALERLIPVGLSDLTGEARAQRYCPSCNDIYHWSSEIYWNIDGAAFGTSFPHFFFLSFPSFVRGEPLDGDEGEWTEKSEDDHHHQYFPHQRLKTTCTLPPLSLYEARIFGFKLLFVHRREFVSHDGSTTHVVEPKHHLAISILNCDRGVGVGQELRSIANYHRCFVDTN